jgi:hypothetical protein
MFLPYNHRPRLCVRHQVSPTKDMKGNKFSLGASLIHWNFFVHFFLFLSLSDNLLTERNVLQLEGEGRGGRDQSVSQSVRSEGCVPKLTGQ